MQRPSSPPERVERQRAHAVALRLWELAHSRCGPRTAEGKKRSALRATKHGLYSEGGMAMAAWLKSLSLTLDEVMDAYP